MCFLLPVSNVCESLNWNKKIVSFYVSKDVPIISLALTWTSSEEPWTSSPKSTSNFPNLRSGKEKINWKTFSIDSWSSLQGLLNKFLDYTRISLIIITFCLHLKQTFNKPWYNFQFHHLSWTVKSNYFCLLWYTNRVIYM